MSLSQKIKYHRQKLGLTLEELGNKVGVSKSTVRKWETGMIANMRRDKIAKLAQALNVSPAYLMGWTDDEQGEEPKPAEVIVNDPQDRFTIMFRDGADSVSDEEKAQIAEFIASTIDQYYKIRGIK